MTASGTLRLRDWAKTQHYKRRNPPWIKSHRERLDDRDYQMLEDGPARLLYDLELVASESSDGCMQFDSSALAWRLRRSVQDVRANLQPLIRAGFVIATGHDASNALALRLHDATPEAETERETESSSSEKIETSWRPELETRAAARLPTEAGRNALTTILAKCGSKLAVVAEIAMILDGGRPNVSRDPASVELALCDFAANEPRWSNDLFRRYVQRAARGDQPVRPPGGARPNPGAQGYANALGGGR